MEKEGYISGGIISKEGLVTLTESERILKHEEAKQIGKDISEAGMVIAEALMSIGKKL